MSARGYALHSVCTQLFFFPRYPPISIILRYHYPPPSSIHQSLSTTLDHPSFSLSATLDYPSFSLSAEPRFSLSTTLDPSVSLSAIKTMGKDIHQSVCSTVSRHETPFLKF